mmetsp:Transcript_81848/g.175355  ORF Transcript_81848/g.175355 Transcript_81848/m.175355 type:complete len:437 (+) Transcript_81848:94-1404(+)|eukprot:CAMPEP_0180436820 /NCGR_PEP_ID=MMETSP1036_2-20121128/11221_1 /TAXON_ID=632150 /ORGANISM="Azadinium spinosum, Strain 3D9" /LENGTH=436 /DNA_ID=CAMNT_0022442843 /DNA_START=5 /DNA_END=1315 /DNA_ORIENTATION=+
MALAEEELPDFDEEAHGSGEGGADAKEGASKGGAGISVSGFKDFLLRPELLQAITECGFEHPSEVQHACIPQAVLGTDIICQAKSGMGKTAVFVLACIQLVELQEKAVKVLVLCHTRELSFQIQHEFLRLGKHVVGLKVGAIFGGVPIEKDKEALKGDKCPHILVGTPGRVLQLLREKDSPLKLDALKHFVLDECDRCIDALDMRRDVQQIFIKTPKQKQVMMFSATMSAETRGICKKFMHSPHEITVESEKKLTLHGLLQYYVKLDEKAKNKKLVDLLDTLEFNQVVVFVKSVRRAIVLDSLLQEASFPSMTLHQTPAMYAKKGKADVVSADTGRIDRLQAFKDFKKRILVTTDLFGRGMDVERVNIVINYDMPEDSDMYLHRVGRAGRFGTKGLAITFSSSDEDNKILSRVQDRFEVTIGEMPVKVDATSYLNA